MTTFCPAADGERKHVDNVGGKGPELADVGGRGPWLVQSGGTGTELAQPGDKRKQMVQQAIVHYYLVRGDVASRLRINRNPPVHGSIEMYLATIASRGGTG